MADCPDCGVVVKPDARSCVCGWRQRATFTGHATHPYKWEDVDPAVLAAIRGAFAKPKRNPRAWAFRIIDRVSRGESVPLHAEQCAREAVRGWQAPREPGQEG